MFFVLAQTREDNRTYERNVRMGGFKHLKSAEAAALRHESPCVIRNHARNTVMMTDNHEVVFKAN